MGKLRGFVSAAGSVLATFWQFIGVVLRSLIGDFDWQAPAWLRWLLDSIASGVHRFIVLLRAHPRVAGASALGIVLLLGGGFEGWRWYERQPKPVELTVSVRPPARTCYECEVPTPNPLNLHFSASAAPLDKVGKDLKPGLELSPAIAGTWHWDNDTNLSFQPAQDWPVGQKYRVSLPHKGFVASQIRLKDHEVAFASPAFKASVVNTEFYQDPVQASDKKVVSTIHFSHPVEPSEFESRIKLKLFSQQSNGKETGVDVAYTVVYDKLRLNGSIHSAQLSVPEKSGRVTLEIAEGVRAVRGGNKTDEVLRASVAVPGLNSLGVSDINLDIARNDRDEPDQVLFLGTSYTVTEKEITAKVHAWLLPEKNPDAKRQKDWDDASKGKPYTDWNALTIDAAVLKASEPLPLEYIANEQEHVEQHGFRYHAEPGRYVYVRVDKGLKSFGGYNLGEAADRVLPVPAFPEELHFTNKGALLALSGAKKLTVFTRDVPGLRVEIGRLLPDQLQHLVTQTRGRFENPQFDNYDFDAANITERTTRDIALPKLAPGAAHYQPIDFGEFVKSGNGVGRGVFLLKIGVHKPKEAKPEGSTEDAKPEAKPEAKEETKDDGTIDGMSDTRLVVVTDLGLLVKKGVSGTQDVFVQSIANGSPVAGVVIDVVGKNGETVLTQTTDAEGHARFADLKSFKREQEPVMYLAHRAGDSSFLPINRHVDALDLSRFDVGGVTNSADSGKLAGYLFSDRGIYRPGEEIRVGAIVKSQDWKQPLAGVPLRVDITDPRGVTLRRETIKLSAAGFEEIKYTTQDTAPVGQYAINLYLVREDASGHDNDALIGSVSVKIQEFQPDRLRMSAHLSSEAAQGWVSPENLKASVSLQNLFGTPAENRRVTAQMTLTPQFPAFADYRDFQFYDPQAAREGFTDTLADGTTDDKGEATFELNLQRFAKATYRLHLVAQGFEADGGRGVAAETAVLVSNLPYLVGFHADGDLGYLSRNSEHKAEVIVIGPDAKKLAVKALTLTRIERRYVSVLIKQDSGTYRYESRKKEITLDTRELEIPAAGFKLPIDTTAPGAYAYVITDAAGQQFARIEYAVAGSANLTRSLDKNAELQVVLSKHDYAPNEDIEMQITAPYAGAGLITIERDKVYAWRWFHTDTTSSVQKIKLPEGIEGNAYVSVSFVRDPGSSEIFTSPLSYGVQPFSVNLDARRNAIQLGYADKLKPGETLKLKYKTTRPSRIVVFAVDEGILQVARYKSADPLGYFFQKRSLDVSTTQILDLILPEFRPGSIAGALGAAPGGDGEGALGKFLNPFKRRADKPVAFWSGIVDADSTERELSYTVPDYFNGTLRIMAVAVGNDAIGTYDGKTLVRGDFVLSPNAPTFATPGDEFEVSVGVSNNVEGSGANAEPTITLMPSSQIEVIGPAEAKLKIAEQHESVARFKVRARDELGAATIVFTSKLGNKSAKRSISLSVRPPSPFFTQLDAGSVKNGTADVLVTRDLYPAYRKLDAGISVLPLSLSRGLTTYLDNYTYSCTEQLVSKAMPAMVLGARPEFGDVVSRDGSTLQGLIGALRSRQNSDGSYGYWAGNEHVVEFASVYAQHFLIDAAERGQAVPRDLIQSGNAALTVLAARSSDTLAEARASAYAIYLLTRQGMVMANEASALQEHLENSQKGKWEQDVIAAYLASAYQLMKQERNADRLIGRLKFHVPPGGYEVYNDSMSRDAQLLYLMSRHFTARLKKLPPDLLDGLVESIKGNRYNTLSSAFTILALDAYATVAGAAEAGKLSLSEVLTDGKTAHELPLPANLFPTAPYSDQAAKIKVGNDGPLSAYWLVTQAGFDRKLPTPEIKDGFEIIHEFTDASGAVLGKVKLGDEIFVHLKYRAIKRDSVDNVAIVDLLPGGFELVVPPQEPVEAPYRAAANESADENAGDNTGESADDAGNNNGDDEPSARADGDAVEDEGGASQAGESDDPAWRCPICTAESTAIDYADFREDRVVFYTSVGSDIRELVYRIKAVSAGTFNLPPAYGESMYERGVRARSLGGKIEVVKP